MWNLTNKAIFVLCFQGGENSVAIDLIVRHVRTQLEQVSLSVKSFRCINTWTNLRYFPLKIIFLERFLSHLERIQFQVRKLFNVSLVFKITIVTLCHCGGAVAPWLVSSTLAWVVQVWVFAGDIVLHSWGRLFARTLHPGVQISTKLWPGGPFGLYTDFLPFKIMP